MTEAAHQMASNPLPPAARKPGSVGPGHRRAASASWTTKGSTCRPASAARSCIQGPNVITGYENNPEANATSFTDGWFRTGDQGFLDADGYLTLVGRLKELINRGGEKISPREIDEVLLDAPGGRRGGLLRRAAPDVGRRSRGRGRAARGAATEAGAAGVLQGAARRLQAPEADPHHRRDSAHGHRQDPAPRRGAGVRADRRRENRHRRRRRDRRLHRRAARAAGADVVLFARGPHLRAMQERGLRVISPDGDFEVQAAGRPATSPTIGTADVVFLGVKAHSLTALAPQLRAALRPRHRRRQHAERHPVVVLPGPSAASSTGCGSSASIRAASSPPPSSRAASSDRSPTSPPTSPSRASSITPRAIASASASRTARESERAQAIAEALIARRVPVPGHDALPPRDLGEAARQRRVQPDQRADRRHARGAGAPSRGVARSSAS